MTYRLHIVNDNDEVLDVITLDGLNLDHPMTQAYVGMKIADGMGTVAREDCASREEPFE